MNGPFSLVTISIILILFNAKILAQVEVKGHFPASQYERLRLPKSAVHQLPEQDNHMLAKVADEETLTANNGTPYKFAQAIEHHIDIHKNGEWDVDTVNQVKKWRIQVDSPGATSISLLFNDFYLPIGSEFYVIGKHRIHGAYTAEHNNMDDRKFAVGLVKGDSVILEYIEPFGVADEAVSIKLHKVVHGFRAGPKHGMSGSCNIDAACADDSTWTDQINSIGLLLTNDGQRFCTGSMVNNVHHDGQQYFLTANHCIFTDVSYFMVGFNYQWPFCKSGGASYNITDYEPSIQIVQGLKVLSSWNMTDFALLQIKEQIPDHFNVYLAGWDNNVLPASHVVGIHHPSGDVKKMSTYSGILQHSGWGELPFMFHWKVPKWSCGITEPGSSGSPLFNNKGLVIGHLQGGDSACDNLDGFDQYGGLAWDWSASQDKLQQLGPFLNPTRVNVTAIKGIYLSAARRPKRQSIGY